MLRTTSPLVLPLAVALSLFGGLLVLESSSREAAAAPASQIGTSLSVDACNEVDAGETVDLTIRIGNTPELFAWEIYFVYDRDLLEVVSRDVRLFLNQGPNSSVFDVSDPVPNSTGIYRLGAADVGLGSTAETGSGNLATITVRAKGTGVSPAAIYKNEHLPLGPRLTGVGGASIADFNADGLFDGRITSGQVAIGSPCSPVAPTPDPDIGDSIVPVVSPSVGVTASGTPRPTAEPGSTRAPSDPGDSPPGADPSNSDDDSTPGTDPTESSDDTPSDGPGSPTPERQVTGGGSGGGGSGGGGGFGSGGDNTFWGIVLIGGGIGLGLVVTYVLAVTTRRPA
jgi:hypothetical protein